MGKRTGMSEEDSSLTHSCYPQIKINQRQDTTAGIFEIQALPTFSRAKTFFSSSFPPFFTQCFHPSRGPAHSELREPQQTKAHVELSSHAVARLPW